MDGKCFVPNEVRDPYSLILTGEESVQTLPKSPGLPKNRGTPIKKFDNSLQEKFISQFIFCNSVLSAFTTTRDFAILSVRRRTPNEKHQHNLGAEADGAITWPG